MAPLAALVPRTYFLAVQGGHLSFCHGAQLCQTSHSTSLTKDMAQKGRLKSWALWSNSAWSREVLCLTGCVILGQLLSLSGPEGHHA